MTCIHFVCMPLTRCKDNVSTSRVTSLGDISIPLSINNIWHYLSKSLSLSLWEDLNEMPIPLFWHHLFVGGFSILKDVTFISLDKMLVSAKKYCCFSYTSNRTYVVGTHLYSDVPCQGASYNYPSLMLFCGKMRKIFIKIFPLICSYVYNSDYLM